MIALHLSSKTPAHRSVDKIISFNSIPNILIVIKPQSYLDVDKSKYLAVSQL